FPAAIDVDLFVPTSNDSPTSHQDGGHERDQSHDWTIMLFSRLEPGKGVEIAAAGIERFLQRHPSVRVLVIDWGEVSTEYRRRYAGRFTFVPRTSPEGVRRLLASADVVVGQFAVGALGISEFEAMCSAKPVIASFRYPDAYPTPPPLCEARTPDEVDAHLEHLYQHPAAGREVGDAARLWVMTNHGYDVLARRLGALYTAIAG